MDFLEQPAPGICWFCVIVGPEDSSHTLPLEYVRASLEKILQNSVAIIYQSRIVLLLQADPDGALSSRMYESLVPFLEGITFKAGVSSPFNDIRKVRVHYLQACCALDVGKDRNPKETVYEFPMYVLTYTVIPLQR